MEQTVLIVAKLLDEYTFDYIYGTLSEYLYDDDTRGFVCGILIETLLSQNDGIVDRADVCDSLFALLDNDKEQQQLDVTTANTHPIASPPTKTEIRPNTKKTHTQPKD